MTAHWREIYCAEQQTAHHQFLPLLWFGSLVWRPALAPLGSFGHEPSIRSLWGGQHMVQRTNRGPDGILASIVSRWGRGPWRLWVTAGNPTPSATISIIGPLFNDATPPTAHPLLPLGLSETPSTLIQPRRCTSTTHVRF